MPRLDPMALLEVAIFFGAFVTVLLAVGLWRLLGGHLARSWQLIILGFMFFFVAEAGRISGYMGLSAPIAVALMETATFAFVLAGLVVQLNAPE